MHTVTDVAQVALQMRPEGGAWQTKELVDVSNAAGDFQYAYPIWLDVATKTDIRVIVISVTASNTAISAGFDLAFWDMV